MVAICYRLLGWRRRVMGRAMASKALCQRSARSHESLPNHHGPPQSRISSCRLPVSRFASFWGLFPTGGNPVHADVTYERMKGVEEEDDSGEKLQKQTEESIDRIRWEFERLAAWIIAHRGLRERGNRDADED